MFIHGKYNLGLCYQFFKTGLITLAFYQSLWQERRLQFCVELTWKMETLIQSQKKLDLIKDVTTGKALPVSHFRTRQ